MNEWDDKDMEDYLYWMDKRRHAKNANDIREAERNLDEISGKYGHNWRENWGNEEFMRQL
ncbi:MAG TPA: hypothetical protein VF070_46295 [Streptosporangiaceae bacterium]